MPDGLKRYHDFEQDHFITFSCDQRLPFLNNDPARIVFENTHFRVGYPRGGTHIP